MSANSKPNPAINAFIAGVSLAENFPMLPLNEKPVRKSRYQYTVNLLLEKTLQDTGSMGSESLGSEKH